MFAFRIPYSMDSFDFPELDQFLKDDEATQFFYKKSWEEGKDDPWLVFHTSGTTGKFHPHR